MTSLEGERNFAKFAVTGMCSAYRDSPYVHTHTHNSTSVLRPSKYEREPVFFTAHHFGGGVHSRTSHSRLAARPPTPVYIGPDTSFWKFF